MAEVLSRRNFLTALAGGGAALIAGRAGRSAFAAKPAGKPNVILCMTDDQGWGDTGYNGHKVLKTPNLDAMAAEGLRFERFYAGAPVCSPTRGSCLTGRHPYRYGILFANVGHMPKQEITLAEALKTRGYTTGHFGKWHLGTLTKTEKDSNRGGPRGAAHYAPPWDHGFDVCFSTEAKVPTYNPMLRPAGGRRRRKRRGKADAGKPAKADPAKRQPYGTYYWTGPGKKADENLEGDDSRIIMDRAIPFIRKAVAGKKPFLAVIWFHTPHLPVLAGPKHRAIYKDQPQRAQHHFGCITAMDEQMGRLRKELKGLGVEKDTMLWFCGDNGPEGRRYTGTNGSAGPLRGRKRSLFEGGIRVPGLLVWPAKVLVRKVRKVKKVKKVKKAPRRTSIPCCTSDYFPTVLDVLGLKMKGQPTPLDGISLLPLIEGKMTHRPQPIGFESGGKAALIDNRYKLYVDLKKNQAMLFDIPADIGEKRDLAAEKPQIVQKMRATLDAWRASCKKSRAGEDYRKG